MRTGVIVLASSVPEANLLAANLQEKGIPVLHCGQDDACNAPETITGFIAGNRLETVVVSNASGSSLPSPLRYAIESAGLGSHAVGWVDLVPLFGEELSQRNVRQASGAVLANVARLQRADYARNAVFRAVARSSKISRRELFRSFPRMLRMESDIPIVLADRCGDRSRSCSYCVKACPVKAVSAAPRAVVIDDRLCIECGACARDCPIGAIQSTSVSDNQMIAMLNTLAGEEVESEKRALLLTCGIGFERLLHEGRQGRHLDPGVVPVQVPCVSFIGSLHYLWAASVGVALATVCPDTSCKKSAAMFPLFHHTASSRNLVKATKGDKACSMRHFGLHANDSIVDIVSRAISPAATAGGARLAEGFRHEVTSEAIRALGADGDVSVKLAGDSALPLFDLRVDSARCSFCELCERDCPDNAIEFIREEEASTLIFDPALCGGCMICEKNCPEKAITISGLTELSPILERKGAARAKDDNAKCANCGTSLGSKRNLASLKKRLLEQGVTEAATKTLDLCVRCKQSALIRPLGQHAQL